MIKPAPFACQSSHFGSSNRGGIGENLNSRPTNNQLTPPSERRYEQSGGLGADSLNPAPTTRRDQRRNSDMPSLGLEILGVTLAVLGWISAVVSCALPMWRVSAFIGVNIVTAQMTWEGIWMNCVVQSTGQMQCKIHDSMLALSADLQAARALTVISIVVGVVGLLVAVMGAKCTNCVEEEAAKARVMIAAGAAFILASLTQMIPVSWSAHSIVVEFYNPIIPEAQKREIGAALYLGWAAAAFLLIGGGILCSSCPQQPEKRFSPPSKMMYPPTRSVAPSSYDRRDYV